MDLCCGFPLWTLVQPKNIIPQQPGRVLGIERGGSGHGMHLLGEPVNHHKDGILPLGFRQGTDEVHGDGGPRTWRGVMGVKRGHSPLPGRLGPLAGIASLHASLDLPAHAGPVVVPGRQLQRLVVAWVPS